MTQMPEEESPATAKQKKAFPYKVLSCEDLLELPPVAWRVKGVLPKTGLAALYGPSRAGKSFLALDLALAITQGEKWFDWQTTPCPVLFVCLEAFEGLPSRVKAWMEETGSPLPNNLHFIHEGLDMRNEEQVRGIIQSAHDHSCEVVIIDTFSRATHGIDENTSRDMGSVIKNATAIQQALGGLVIFVAHPGKEDKRDIRGHSSLFAALDAVIRVGGIRDDRFLELDKVKEAEDGTKIQFWLKPVTVGADPDGEPVYSCVVVPLGVRQKEKMKDKSLTKGEREVLASLKSVQTQQGTNSISLDVWRKHYHDAHSDKEDAANRKAFQRGKEKLIELGKITIFGNVVTICDTPL